MAQRRSFQRLARGFALAGALGSGFAGAVAIGLLAGARIDAALGWRPIAATLALGVLGGIAGIVFVIRSIAALERLERREGAPEARRAPAETGRTAKRDDASPPRR